MKPPICIVTSLGRSYDVPTRNRTILAGLIRDVDNPKATRIEMRAPNPFTNTYMVTAAFYLSALDGIVAVLRSGKDTKALEKKSPRNREKKDSTLKRSGLSR